MGNGNCNRCKCNNCDKEENNNIDNYLDKNIDIIKNDSYESFENEINKNKSEENNINKTVQLPKILENEKNTTNNNQENITENKKEKNEIENENNNTINNKNEKDDKIETIIKNNNINHNDNENRINEIIENIKLKKENFDLNGIEKVKMDNKKNDIENNIHIVNIKNQNFEDSKRLEEITENKEKIKNEENKIKPKINKTRNNIEEFNIINNDLVYITNKNNNINENTEYKEHIEDYQNSIDNKEIKEEEYEYKYDFDNNDNYNNFNNFNNFNNYNINNKNTNILNINKIMDIHSIIPKNKLLKLNDDSIICNSVLEKIIKIPERNKIVYNERFCILTKTNFSYYKSKESYLNLSKPMLSINLKNIIKVEQTILDDTSYYFGLICIINDDTKKYIDKINTFINIGETNSEEFLLGFRSKNKDLIIKWIVVLNYFIEITKRYE